MSTDRRRLDEGFTLVEVLVAMTLTFVMLVVTLPVLMSMLKSGVSVRQDTRAKNLSQERVEQLRDLRYHIDRQNGPFLDLLDIYYTNATVSATPTTLTVGGTTLSGTYVSSGAAANGEPAAPYYRTTIANVAGAANYSQVVAAQFLGPDGTAVPAARFQGTYDSQVVGRDQAPSTLVGITVITKWTSAGKAKTLRTYTRITDGRTAAPIIQTQARSVAVDVTSTGADGATLELQQGIASADGAQSSGSTVSGFAAGALATRTGATTVSGATGQFNLPTATATTGGSSSPQTAGSCGWYGFGRTSVSNVTGDISTGLPKAPADVDLPNTLSGSVMDNSGGSCGLMTYDNLTGGGLAVSTSTPVGQQMGGAPYVSMPDTAGGSGAAVTGSAYVSSNTLTSVPQKSVAGASAVARRALVLFPNNPDSGGRGLVSVTLTSASVSCGSGSASADGTVVGSYTLSLGWWGKAGSTSATATWHTATWTYNSATGSTPVLSGETWAPSTTYLNNGLRLSDLVTSSFTTAPAVVTTGAATGLRGFTDGIVTLTTASTLTNETGAGYSAIKVQVGQLTCVADDQR